MLAHQNRFAATDKIRGREMRRRAWILLTIQAHDGVSETGRVASIRRASSSLTLKIIVDDDVRSSSSSWSGSPSKAHPQRLPIA